MVAILNLLVCMFFLIWLLLTIVNQFDTKFSQEIRKYDIFHLLPRWTFFAPNPGTSDYHFLYRFKSTDNQISAFIEIPLHGNRNILSAVWNSNKRLKKALLDLVMDINRLCAQEQINESNIKISFSYIALLNFITSIEKPYKTNYVQFVILKSDGFIEKRDPQLILCSEFHHV